MADQVCEWAAGVDARESDPSAIKMWVVWVVWVVG